MLDSIKDSTFETIRREMIQHRGIEVEEIVLRHVGDPHHTLVWVREGLNNVRILVDGKGVANPMVYAHYTPDKCGAMDVARRLVSRKFEGHWNLSEEHVA